MKYDLGLNDWRGDSLIFGYAITRDTVESINADLKGHPERLSANWS